MGLRGIVALTEGYRRVLRVSTRWLCADTQSSNPPPTVPQYMAVIVSSSMSESGPVISGGVKRIVIVRTNPGYGPAPGHGGTGQLVAIIRSVP